MQRTGVLLPSTGAYGSLPVVEYSAAPLLANCGNSPTGSTSLVGWKTPASSSGLSPSTTGPPNVPSNPSIGIGDPDHALRVRVVGAA